MSAYTYTSDSELMTHYSATAFHPQSADIAAVYDENQNPLVFSITNDANKTLTVTIADPTTGANSVIDLSSAFGVTDPVTHICAFQDDSANIYLAFAVTTATSAPSSVYVCSGVQPSTWRQPASLTTILIPASQATILDVQQLILVRAADQGSWFFDSNYPLLVAQYAVPNKSHPNVERIRIDDDKNTWELVSGEMDITADSTVVDLAIGSARKGWISLMTLCQDVNSDWVLQATHHNTNFPDSDSVITVLVTPQSESHCSLKPRSSMNVLLIVADANNLSVTQSDSGLYDLIIGGDGIYHYSAEQLFTTDTSAVPPEATQLTSANDSFSQGIKDMITCQSQTTVTVWIRTAAGNICTNTLAI